MPFTLDLRLEALSHSIGVIETIDIRLADDSRYVWLYLVPQLPDISELDDMAEPMRDKIMSLATSLSTAVKAHYNADKMNIASIGNIVPQFHLHIVARHNGDAAWPDPIWGRGTMQPYSNEALKSKITELQRLLATCL